MSKKIYAVRVGRIRGIFTDWEQCHRSIDKYANSEYKAFNNLLDAKAYLLKKDIKNINTVQKLANNTQSVIAYVKGSFSEEVKIYSFGCVLIVPDAEVVIKFGTGNDKTALAIKNVAGEILATLSAVEWAVDNGNDKITIMYEYIGISRWFYGDWEPENDFIRNYVDEIKRLSKEIYISFKKVKTYTDAELSNDAYNKAREALEDH